MGMRTARVPRVPRVHALRSVAVVLFARLFALAACGTTSSDQSGAPGSSQSSKLNLTGAVTGAIASVGACVPASGSLFKPVWTETIGGKLYLFQIAITHYKGAATVPFQDGQPSSLACEIPGLDGHRPRHRAAVSYIRMPGAIPGTIGSGGLRLKAVRQVKLNA